MDLHVKYRPRTLSEMLGQDTVVNALTPFFDGSEDIPHLFLFSGDSGIGKTTLARIVASEVGCSLNAVLEIDAATNSGIDSMRTVADMVQFKAMGISPTRCVILDECHALSASAWKSLLKITEEPPDHVYFCLCTTELGKVPKTIKTRAHSYSLVPVDSDDLYTLLVKVSKKEKIELTKKQLRLISEHSEYSPRQALVNLSMCRHENTSSSILRLLKSSVSSKDAISLFRLLISGEASFEKCVGIVKEFKDISYESVRIQLLAYVSKVLESQCKSESKSMLLLSVLHSFSKPFNKSTEKAEFYLALGTLLLGEE